MPPHEARASTSRPRRAPVIPMAGREYQWHRAGIVTRLLAAVIDSLVVVLLGIAVWLVHNALRFLLSRKGFVFTKPTPGVDLVWLCVFAFVYLTIAWAVAGRTVGDSLFGLRVVSRRGRRLNWATAAIRALLYVVFPILLLWVAVSREHRSVQDVLLRTSVVYDWSREP